MTKLMPIVVGVLAALLIACGGVADSPQGIATPSIVPAPEVQQAANTPGQPQTKAPAELLTEPAQTGVDDERVGGLVAEWETDLAPIRRVAECVERALELDRPLRPEDFQLQANQPAILSCVKAEVGNE